MEQKAVASATVRPQETITLNNSMKIPVVGLGTYKSDKKQVQHAISDAIDAGYRHFDCAWLYGNEDEVGQALHSKIAGGLVQREDLFITSKLWNNFHEKSKVIPMLEESLGSLGLHYVDLYLINWPFGFKENAPLCPTNHPEKSYSNVDYLETWEGMENCVKQGLAKSIGVSNFNPQQITRLLDHCKIKPVVNQVEVTPNLNQKDLIKFCKEHEIVVTGYAPLGRSAHHGTSGGPTPTMLDPKVIQIGEKYKKSAAQVVLNYLVSLGISVVPRSVHKSHICENINIFDFTLAPADVAYLDSLNKNQRVVTMSEFSSHPHYSF
ncbi:hypothetical protein Zmor_009837 [Zophobas morio]|uniref:NADP-dependent oxidoreductase domain-containing protein n=1 Tax=Zophobas morio TaxID=2755281 RepID=A0AA38MJ11_9CUCU|nr:hypothetical protein Zmor_009837 [Zophobas morio]